MTPLLSQVDIKKNYLDFLRFFAATLVIISHSYSLFGQIDKEPFYRIGGFAGLGTLGVIIFFVISGYLIARSWLNEPKLLAFFQKRILRIFPAFIVAVLVTVYIFGYFTTTLDRAAYLEHPTTQNFLYNILFYARTFQSNLPGVFEGNYSTSANGSLWTLPIEFLMYISLALLGSVAILKRRFIVLLLTTALIALDLLINSGVISEKFGILYMRGSDVIHFGSYFFLGSLGYLYRDKILLSGKLALLLLFIMTVSFSADYGRAVSYLTLPYLVIYTAFIPFESPFQRFAKYGDFSYGLYIYAWPVQQVLVQYWGAHLNLEVYALLSFIITLGFAVASWFLVEKWAMKLKSRQPKSFLYSDPKRFGD